MGARDALWRSDLAGGGPCARLRREKAGERDRHIKGQAHVERQQLPEYRVERQAREDGPRAQAHGGRPQPPREPCHDTDSGQGSERRIKACRERGRPEQSHAQRRRPVLQRRLLDIRQAVEVRNDPVMALQHFARNLGVPPLVRVEQRTRRQHAEPDEDDEGGQRGRRPALAHAAAGTASVPERPGIAACTTRRAGHDRAEANAWIVAMRVTRAPASRQRTKRSSKAARSSMPSSSACSVNTCSPEDGTTRERSNTAAPTVASSMPSSPMSSSNVGRVVGYWGQGLAALPSNGKNGFASTPAAPPGLRCEPRVARVQEPVGGLETQRMVVDLPARRGMRAWRKAKDPLERREPPLEFDARPVGRGLRDVILPAYMIVSMQADLEARVAHAAHDVARGAPDIGPRQQHAVHQGLESVVFDNRGPRDLLEESWAQRATQCPPGVIGPDRKIKRRIHPVLLEQRQEARHAFPGAAQRIDIDLEADVRVFKHRATTAPRPWARSARRNRKSRPAPRACRSSASIRARPWCS